MPLRIFVALCLSLLTVHATVPAIVSISDAGEVALRATDSPSLKVGDAFGEWRLMAIIAAPRSDGERAAVFENFSDLRGRILVVGARGVIENFSKSYEPGTASTTTLYRGHSAAEVMGSDRDLLGEEILAEPGDPTFAKVAACLPPISRMNTYTFVGTREGSDKIAFAYGGRTAAFDPAVFVPAIRQIRAAHAVADGLVGGWLPVVRFVYPEESGAWTEMLAYAPNRLENDNRWAQPTWYRLARVEAGRLQWVRYFDSYVPYPPRADQPPARFYEELAALHDGWEKAFTGAMKIDVPDARLTDMARHSLVRAMITRLSGDPKYGVVDRNYGGSEHDGFPVPSPPTPAPPSIGAFSISRENTSTITSANLSATTAPSCIADRRPVSSDAC